jgi:hypothetical protein
MYKTDSTVWIYEFKFREMCKLCSNLYLLHRVVEINFIAVVYRL